MIPNQQLKYLAVAALLSMAVFGCKRPSPTNESSTSGPSTATKTAEVQAPQDLTPFPDLPLITFNSSTGTIDQLRSILGRSSLHLSHTQGSKLPVFSIDVHDSTFWEVFRVMEDKHPFLLMEGEPGLALMPEASKLKTFEVSGPTICFARFSNYARAGEGLPPAPGDLGSYNVQLVAAMDPRITVVDAGHFVVLSAVDSDGRALTTRVGSSDQDKGLVPGNIFQQQIIWPAGDNKPNSVSIKCEVIFGVQVSEDAAIFEDAESKVGQRFKLGAREFKLFTFGIKKDTLEFLAGPPSSNWEPYPITYRVTGSKDEIVYDSTMPGIVNTPIYAPLKNSKGPFRFEARGPIKKKDFSFPFEIKNIPLPHRV